MDRRAFLAFAGAAYGMAIVQRNAAAASLATQESNWRLFLDDHWLARIQGAQRRIARPLKGPEPVIRPQGSCAENPYVYGTMLYDPDRGLFRLWYNSYNRSAPPHTVFLYAESPDALIWNYPRVVEQYCGHAGLQNAFMIPAGVGDLHNPSVIDDRREKDGSRRFKMVFSDYWTGKDPYKNGGIGVAFSSDGLKWKQYGANPVLRFQRSDQSVSDVIDLFQDPVTGQFELYSKGWTGWEKRKNGRVLPLFRTIVRTVSPDLIHWSEPQTIISHAFNEEDPQSYGMPVFQSGEFRVGLLRSYKSPGNDGIDIRLTASRDGSTWFYPGGFATFIERGQPGSFDAGMIFTAPPVVVRERTYIAYGGWDREHASRVRRSAIGIATMPSRRFCAISPISKKNTAVVETVAMESSAANLSVNVSATERTPMRVEVTDLEGAVLSGYSREQCKAVTIDAIAAPIRWSSRTLLPAGKPYRLRFVLNGCSIFGFDAGSNLKRIG